MPETDTDISSTWSAEEPDKEPGAEFALEDDPNFAAGSIEEPPLAREEEDQPGWGALPAVEEAFETAGRVGGDQPVPRITIQAFCDRPEVAKTIETAGRDRRLTKAILTVTPGGLDAAVASLAENASPNLIVIDTTAPAGALLRGLDRLAELVDENAKVVIIGAANDIALYRELMRRGVSEYLVGPIQPLQFIQSVSALYVNPEKPFVGRIIAVLGAKGGVGASTLAHNLGWTIAERYGANTTLMDLDLAFGTVGLDFNQDQTQGVAEALLAPERVDEVFLDRLLQRQSERLTLFTAPATLEREFELDPSAYEVVIDRVRHAVPFVVLDLPHVWTGWMKQTILSADDVILVTTPDLAGLRNCKNLLDLVRAARPHDAPPTIALNMVGVPKRPEIPLKDFGEALGVEPSFSIPFEPAVFGQAANNGQMILEMSGESKSGMALDQMARALCGREPVAKKKASLTDVLSLLKR
jgi:pilus assembly protein CpaE